MESRSGLCPLAGVLMGERQSHPAVIGAAFVFLFIIPTLVTMSIMGVRRLGAISEGVKTQAKIE